MFITVGITYLVIKKDMIQKIIGIQNVNLANNSLHTSGNKRFVCGMSLN